MQKTKSCGSWILHGALAGLLTTAGSLCCGSDWYTRYDHTTGGLVARFAFDDGEGQPVQDRISRKSATGRNVRFVPGWAPQSKYEFKDNGKLAFPDVAGSEKRHEYSLAFHARVTGGGGYLILKKSAFGFSVDNNQAAVYVHLTSGKDFALSAGSCDGNWHFWTITVSGNEVKVYCDGVERNSGKLPAPPAANENEILLGHSGGWKAESILGEMALLRIFSRALTSGEVAGQAREIAAGKLPTPGAEVELSLPVGAANVFVGDDASYEKKPLALYFDGKSSMLTMPDYPELNALTAFTVGAWIKPEHTMPKNISEQGYIVSQNSGAHAGWSLGTYYNNGLNANLITDQGRYNAVASQVLTPGVWQHVAASWDGHALQLFVNGRPVGQSALTQGKFVPFKGRAVVGRAADRDGLFFKGTVDELRIFNTALTVETDPEIGIPVHTEAGNEVSATILPPFPGVDGRTPEIHPLVDFEDLNGWSVTTFKGISEAELVRSQEDRLWGNYVAKLTYRSGKHFDPARKKIVLTPPQPIEITQPFNYIELWLSAQNWAKSSGIRLDAELTDAAGKIHRIPMQSAETPFIFWSGWSLLMKKITEPITVPAQLRSLTFYDFDGGKPAVLYLDNLAVFQMPEKLAEGVEIPSWEAIGAPTSPAGARPTLATEAGRETLRKQQDSYIFETTAGRDRIRYLYTPKSGTLSDLRAIFNDRPEFSPMQVGGFRWVKPDGGAIAPDDPALTAKLLDIRADGRRLATRWEWYYKGEKLAVAELNLSIAGKTLTVELAGGGGNVSEVVTGTVSGIGSPILQTIPYWVIRGRGVNDPAVLYSDGMLLSAFADIYASRASELFGGSKILSDNSAQVNGGARYNHKTDGRRNEVRERLHLTLSSDLSEVLPHIANPVNPTLPVTKESIWVTRMWYDLMPYPAYFTQAYELLEQLHRYGCRNLLVRDHQSLGRQYSPKRRGGFDGMVTEILPDLGGDAAAAEYFRKANDELGYRMGLYSNYTLLSPTTASEMNRSKLTLDSAGDPRYGSGSAKMYKYAYILDCQRRLNAVLKKKFKLRCTYPDQYTCRPPWAYTDYDARVPEAGCFSPVLRVFAASLIQERKDFDIPLSEGIMQWPLAGFCDSYAQSGSPDDPYFPEFQLRKIHPLSNDTGCHLNHLAASDPQGVDKVLALQFANGTSGHLYGVWGGTPPKHINFATLKSYYIPKQTQKYYVGVPIQTIRYEYNGKLLTAEEAIAARCIGENRLYLQYANGLEAWVNGNSTKTWDIDVHGVGYTLPPQGYYVELPGKVRTYSVLRNGRRVDFSEGDEYIYANGGGVTTDFGAIKCAGAYTLRRTADCWEVVPVPFLKDECITLDLRKSGAVPFSAIVALSADGRELKRTVPTGADHEKLELPVAADAFMYRVL